jgi:hypothetical protein
LKKIADILALCIEDVKAGRSTIEDCLGKYASMRQQLEPLLKIALSIKDPGNIQPSADFKARARTNIMQDIHARQTKAKWWQIGFGKGRRPAARLGWSRAVVIAVAVVLAISALGGGTVYASQDSFPGDVIYPVKIGSERIQLMLTPGDAARARLELGFADRRLQEMEILANVDPGRISLAISRYQNRMEAALVAAEKLEVEGAPATLSEKMALAISRHLSVLYQVEDKAPEEVVGDIEWVQALIAERQVGFLRNMVSKNPVRATEITLEAMQRCLVRADVTIAGASAERGERALGQFIALRGFGNGIAQYAHDSGDNSAIIDEMNVQSTSNHLAILGDIYRNAPQSMRGNVERAMRLSTEAYYQSTRSLQAAGKWHDLPEKPQLPENIPGRVKERILENLPDIAAPEGESADGNGFSNAKGANGKAPGETIPAM